MQTSALTNPTPLGIPFASKLSGLVGELRESHRDEALMFLGSRSLHAAYLTGLIRDNGISSTLNRGTFYGFRNRESQLEGIALIGHAILIEAHSSAALAAFAEIAKSVKTAHLIMCEESRTDTFWGFYSDGGQEMHHASRHLHLELRWPVEVTKPSAAPRLAVMDDLALLIPIHAEMALQESGVDPRVTDPKGFEERYARRIEQGRTWIWVEGGRVQFKADVISETPETTYIEGVWVNPEIRRRGYGHSCMSQLARLLLWRTKSLCVSINDENPEAISFFKQGGYHMRGVYDTIFLR